MVDDTGDDDKLKRPLGPTGEAVRSNIIRLRTARHMGYTELSERLKDLDRRIPPLGLRRIENGARRVDADDLFAIAVALGVSPVNLLMPNAEDGDEKAMATAVDEECHARRLWDWLSGYEPLDPEESTLEYRLKTLPTWKKRELLANTRYVDADFSGGSDLGVK